MKKCNENSPRAGDPDYICNPVTGRWVLKRGPKGQEIMGGAPRGRPKPSAVKKTKRRSKRQSKRRTKKRSKRQSKRRSKKRSKKRSKRQSKRRSKKGSKRRSKRRSRRRTRRRKTSLRRALPTPFPFPLPSPKEPSPYVTPKTYVSPKPTKKIPSVRDFKPYECDHTLAETDLQIETCTNKKITNVTIKKKLGAGGFGTVYLINCRMNGVYLDLAAKAEKVVCAPGKHCKPETFDDHLGYMIESSEISYLMGEKKLGPKVYDSFYSIEEKESEKNINHYLIMEPFDDSCSHAVKSIGLTHIKKMIKDMFTILRKMVYDQEVYCTDVKLENFLYRYKGHQTRMTDFGAGFCGYNERHNIEKEPFLFLLQLLIAGSVKRIVGGWINLAPSKMKITEDDYGKICIYMKDLISDLKVESNIKSGFEYIEKNHYYLGKVFKNYFSVESSNELRLFIKFIQDEDPNIYSFTDGYDIVYGSVSTDSTDSTLIIG